MPGSALQCPSSFDWPNSKIQNHDVEWVGCTNAPSDWKESIGFWEKGRGPLTQTSGGTGSHCTGGCWKAFGKQKCLNLPKGILCIWILEPWSVYPNLIFSSTCPPLLGSSPHLGNCIRACWSTWSWPCIKAWLNQGVIKGVVKPMRWRFGILGYPKWIKMMGLGNDNSLFQNGNFLVSWIR